MCVNKAGKKLYILWSSKGTGFRVTTMNGGPLLKQNQTSTASVCETLNLYKLGRKKKTPSDPKIAILDWSSSSQRVTTQSRVTIKSVSGLNTRGFICFEVTALDLFTHCSKVTVLQRGLIQRNFYARLLLNLSR